VVLGGQRADQLAAAGVGSRSGVEGAFLRLRMGQDLAGNVFPQYPHLPLERDAALDCLAQRADPPFQAAAQHRVMVDDLQGLLGDAFVSDGHQAPPHSTTPNSLNNFSC
jgi:hypothetical protein